MSHSKEEPTIRDPQTVAMEIVRKLPNAFVERYCEINKFIENSQQMPKELNPVQWSNLENLLRSWGVPIQRWQYEIAKIYFGDEEK